jgi:LuxR family maltose regulon positive regulatory protein
VQFSTPLLTTKLHPPPARATLVDRTRLVTRLNETRLITLISAPAGYGKSTLVSQLKQPFAWLSIDADDNDPVRFFSYVIAALQTLSPRLGVDALGLLQAPQPPLKHIVSVLINDIAEFQKPIALVLDDYHLITNAIIHDAIAYWLDHGSANFRLILSTREDPPLPLPRWRARQQLTEIRAIDLRFMSDEAADFLNRVMNLRLTAEDMAAVEQRTEGWAAGLQLAAHSLAEYTDRAAFIAALTGSHRHIADYLTTEFFNRQNSGTQTFLLHTSILDRFCAPLVEALLESSAAQTTLENLERENVLIEPLDVDRRWWRYHALLADMLRARLDHAAPQLVTTLHTRASSWFEQQGFAEEAVQHALRANDHANSARLIAAFATDLMKRDDFATLRRWLAQLPENVIWANPRLCLAQIWTLLDFNQPDSTQIYFERVNELLTNAHEPALQTEALMLRAIAEAMAYRSDHALALAKQAQKINVAADPLSRALIAYALGAAYKMGNDGLRAEQCFREAGLAALAAESAYLAIDSLANLGDLQVDMGRLPEAEQSLQRALEQARTLTHVERPSTGWLHWDLARVHYEWNDLETALSEAEQSVALCAIWGNAAIWIRALLVQTQVHQARQQWLAAQACLDEAEQIAQRDSGPALRQLVAQRRTLIALAQNDLPRAQLLAETLQAQTPWPYHRQAYVMARLCLAQGQPQQALDYLKQHWQSLEKTNLGISRIQSLIVEALARRALGQREQALLPLERALVMAQPGGIVTSFIEHGAPMQELLRRAATNSTVPLYAQKLLAAFQQTPSEKDQSALTQREMEILHLLSAGLSNRQMSEQLVISEATLKRHISNLYLKLDVHSRTQALVKAAELRLL